MSAEIDQKAPATEEEPGPFLLGLKDWVRSGWFNAKTGELMTGFQVTSDDIVVDVGCGDGGLLNFCAQFGAHVILIDADGPRLERARQRLLTSTARKVEAYETNGEPLPLPDASVTRVICTEVLEHVDDPKAFIAELVRVGQPGALYLISVPGTAIEKLQTKLAPPVYFEKPNHIRIFEQDDFAALIEGAGLKIEHRSSYGFFWSIWWLLFWQAGLPFDPSKEQHHPLLDAWTKTWSELLKSPNGQKTKQALDDFLPKSQAIVARKPL